VSPATVEAGGLALAYDERGAGRPLVLVHGVGVARGLWEETVEALGGDFRTVAYDRRGYADSGAPEGYAKTTVEEHADDLIALIRGLDAAPALLCALSFASMVCLDAMAREPGLVRGAVLIEPPLLWLSPNGAEAMSGMRAAIEEGARSGGSDGALDAFARHLCGPQAPDLIGRERSAIASRTPHAFAADFSAPWSLPTRALRGIEQPVTVISAKRSAAGWREAAATLAEMLPRGELVEVDGGHLVPLEAPRLLADELRALERRAGP
jgi:pimeloyl-ACP methyl ester carboxylesterase